jgi:hypothetical protein
MARLFITPRELDFISDITKELVKDVVGQKIYYYSVREDLSDVNDVYDEAPEKVFDKPIEIEVRVDWMPEEVRTTKFGSEEILTQEIYVHWRDVIDKDINIREGDYYSYGKYFFEITSAVFDKQIYGQVEYFTGVKLAGKQARKGQIRFEPIGPIGEHHTDDNAIQDTFVQQRGFSQNRLGETNDVRALQDNGVLTSPISGPAEVSPDGNDNNAKSSFYDET